MAVKVPNPLASFEPEKILTFWEQESFLVDLESSTFSGATGRSVTKTVWMLSTIRMRGIYFKLKCQHTLVLLLYLRPQVYRSEEHTSELQSQ